MPRYDDIYEYPIKLDGTGLRVGIVMSRFNQDVCEGLLAACTAELLRLGVATADMVIATVPGALEIPPTLKRMATSGRFDALVALGAVIRGDTYHFEVVSNDACHAIACSPRAPTAHKPPSKWRACCMPWGAHDERREQAGRRQRGHQEGTERQDRRSSPAAPPVA